jgi:hypothetical protein
MTTKTLTVCRDCRHWRCNSGSSSLDELPRDKAPEDGWIFGKCSRIRDGIEVNIDVGWDGGSVNSIETDANFGCIFGEVK